LAQDQVEDDPFAGVEEMVVTGTGGTAALLSSTSDSVTAFDAELITDIGAQDISDLASFTPNLEIVTAGTTQPTLFIRGVGLNDFSPAATGAIAVFQDGVQRNSSAIQLGRLFDLDGVVIERGPQGTGPFRNAEGGAILVKPRRPSGEFGAKVTYNFGNYDSHQLEVAAEMPIIADRLSVRIAAAFYDREGYTTNLCAGATVDPGVAPNVTNRPPYSRCGERVTTGRRTHVPEGLRKNLNAEHDWAGRAIFGFTPDSDWDQSWFLNLHISQLDDDSVAGQAIGTLGLRTLIDPSLPASGGNVLANGLGGTDTFGYREAGVTRDRQRIAQFTTAQCFSIPAGPARTACQREQAFIRDEILSYSLVSLDQDPWVGAYNRAGRTNLDTWGVTLNGEVELPGGATFKTTWGADAWDAELENDIDFSPNVIFESLTDHHGTQFYGEARVDGETSTEIPFIWELGGVGLYEDLRVETEALFTEDVGAVGTAVRDFHQTTIGGGFWGDFTVELTENFNIDAGARINFERKIIDFYLLRGGATRDEKFDDFEIAPVGVVKLNYEPTEDARFYIKYTHGWKSMTHTPTTNAFIGVVKADPEQVEAYEAGVKLSFFDSRLTVTGAIFFYDYDNYQIFLPETGFGGNADLVVINAGTAENYGAELEAVIEPFELSRIQLTAGWLESQFLDFARRRIEQAGSGVTPILVITEIDNAGNRLLNSPRFTLSIIASQGIEVGDWGVVTARYTGTWTDSVFFDPTEGRGIPDRGANVPILPKYTIGQSAYWLHGIALEWEAPQGNMKVSGWARNLTNKAYKRFAADATAVRSTTLNWIGEPRTYGMSVDVEF